MPPMLHISLLKLTARAQQKLFPHEMRLAVNQCHRILKLVAEPEGAPRLIIAASRPETTSKRLIQEPAIGQHIEGLIGCLHMHGSQRVRPMLPQRLKRSSACCRTSKTTNDFAGIVAAFAHPQPKGNLALMAVS